MRFRRRTRQDPHVFLVDAMIHGFRRFGGEAPHKLLVDARMVCIIGANEAGKSSLLEVLADALDAEPVDRKDRTRREPVSDDAPIVTLHYRLDPADQAAVSDLYTDQHPPAWFTVTKTAGARITASPDQRPRRDRAPRTLAREALNDDAVRVRLTTQPEAHDDDELVEAVASSGRLDELNVLLDAERETIPADELDELKHFADRLREAGELALADVFDAAEAAERQPHPRVAANDRLWKRTPTFVAFQALRG